MNDLRTAAQQALEALEQSETFVPYEGFGMARREAERKHQAAITALRAALAQQDEPKPMSPEQRQRWKELAAMPQQAEPLNLADPAVQKRLATQWGYVPAAQAEPVEPVAWMFELARNFNLEGYGGWEKRITEYRPNTPEGSVRNVTPLYTAPPQRKPLTEKEMYAVDEEARKNFRLSQKGPRGQQITYWDGLTPWLIRAVERAHGIKEN